MCNSGIAQFYQPPTHEPYLPLLPSRKASPPFDCYSLRLLMKGWPGWVDLGGWSHTEINVRHRICWGVITCWCNYVSEAAQAHACSKAVDQCLMPVGATYAGMTEQQVLDKIRTTDLTETCRCVDVQETVISIVCKYNDIYCKMSAVWHNVLNMCFFLRFPN